MLRNCIRAASPLNRSSIALSGSKRMCNSARATGGADQTASVKDSAEPSIKPDEQWDDDITKVRQNTGSSPAFPEYGNKPKGPEPTRFGDWQYKGRSTDF